MKKRVVLVDDHAALRQMLGLLLSRESEYEIAGEAGTGLQALRLCAEVRPEIVILDLMLPELCGTEVLRRLRRDLPAIRVLIYSGTLNQLQIVETLKLRPHGFVEKSGSLPTLRAALHAVSRGSCYFTPLVSAFFGEVQTSMPLDLTRREQEVLQLVAEGHTSKQAAGCLGIAVKTVENHRAHLMDKLHLHDIAALTRLAVSRGLVPP